MESFGIVLVTYHPDLNVLVKNVVNYSKIAKSVIVVNNSSELEFSFDELKNVRLINLGGNKGIAEAQNTGVRELKKQSVKFVFFSDQDSVFELNFFSEMINQWKKIQKKNCNIGLLAPAVFDRNNREFLPIHVCTLNGVYTIVPSIEKNGYINNTMPISSGSLMKVSTFEKIGGNESELFIDWVDIDLDWRLIEKGYGVYTTLNVRMDHALGLIKKRKIFFKNFTIINYPPIRDYYYLRNGIYLLHKFKKSKLKIRNHIKVALIYKIKDILLEEKVLTRLKWLSYAVKDGLKMINSGN